MQISKFSLWFCVFALGGSLMLCAEDKDNPAQAAARAALLRELDNNPPPAAQPPAAPVQPAKNMTTPPAQTPSVAISAPAAVKSGSTADTPAQAAARAALMEKLQQLGGNPPAATPTPTPVAAAPAPASVVAPATPAALPVANVPMTASGDTEAQVRARAALLQKLAEMPATGGTGGTGTGATAATPMPVPIVAPALPISMTKEEKLQWLLTRYKADLITPEQYHEQRAAILAAP